MTPSATGERRNCGPVALMLTTGEPYDKVHKALREQGRRTNRATHGWQLMHAGSALGYNLKRLTLRKPNGGKYTVRTVLDALKPKGNYILYIHDHFVPVVAGEVRDWTAGSLHRVKWVYEVTPKRKLKSS